MRPSTTVLFVLISSLLVVAGCGTSSGNPALSVVLAPAPPTSMSVNATANISATIRNDATHQGVIWACAPSSSCGSFSPAQTAPGATTTYTAPATMPPGGAVTVIAAPAADTSKTASATISIVPPPSISVSIATRPPASMQMNGTATIAATISNDAANQGLVWSCLPSGSCGSFSPAQTANGGTTTYTAPAVAPQGGSITLAATSITDPTKAAVTTLTISTAASNATLTGQYAFLLTGQNNLGSYSLAGSITLDGNGNVTGGEQDLSDMTGPEASPLTGTYSVGPDGRGTMTLNLTNPDARQFTETFALTTTSASHALLNQDDGYVTASGVLDLQSAGPSFTAAQFSGGYSFTMAGQNQTAVTYVVFGGVFSADAVGALQNGTLDQNDDGNFTSAAFTGTFTAPDANGRGTIATSNNTTFAYYIVRPGVIRLVEKDLLFVVSGTAYAQGAGPFTDSSLAGNFVLNNVGSSFFGPFALAGQFLTDSNGNFTSGTADANDSGLTSSGSLAGSTYSFANNPRGAITIAGGTVFRRSTNFIAYLTDPNLNLLDPNNPAGGGGALIFINDPNISGVGVIVPQVLPAQPNLQGNYAANLISAPVNSAQFNSGEVDLTGQLVGDSSGGLNGSVTYANDCCGDAASYSPAAGSYAGTFAADPSNLGRYTGTARVTSSGTLQFVPSGTTQNLAFYQANSSQVFVIETDPTVCVGILVHQ